MRAQIAVASRRPRGRRPRSVRLAADALEPALLRARAAASPAARAELADLVEEQRAAVGQLEPAALRSPAPGERALLVTEQLALEQGLAERGAVDGDERRRAPAAWYARATSSLPVPLSPRINSCVPAAPARWRHRSRCAVADRHRRSGHRARCNRRARQRTRHRERDRRRHRLDAREHRIVEAAAPRVIEVEHADRGAVEHERRDDDRPQIVREHRARGRERHVTLRVVDAERHAFRERALDERRRRRHRPTTVHA